MKKGICTLGYCPYAEPYTGQVDQFTCDECIYYDFSITNEPQRLIKKDEKTGAFYVTDDTGYIISTSTNKHDFPLINCIQKLWEYEELEAQGKLKLCD